MSYGRNYVHWTGCRSICTVMGRHIQGGTCLLAFMRTVSDSTLHSPSEPAQIDLITSHSHQPLLPLIFSFKSF